MSKRHFLRQCLVTASVASNLVCTGCVSGFAAVLLPSLRQPGSTIRPSEAQESWIASAVALSVLIGNIVTTLGLDPVGRRRMNILSTLPIILGWVLLLCADSVALIIVSRFIQGVSVGMAAPLGSVIISEMTEPKNRGFYLATMSLAITTGIMLIQVAGSFLTWQKCAVLSLTFSATSLALILLTPESPSWLLSKGKVDESRKVFRYLRGDGSDAEEELYNMVEAQTKWKEEVDRPENVSMSTKIKASLKYFGSTCGKPEFFKPLVIIIHLMFMVAFSGFYVMVAYLPDVLHAIVGKESNILIWIVGLNVGRLLSNISALFLMKFMKRRSLLSFLGTLCIVTVFGIGLYIHLKEYHKFSLILIPVVLLGCYMFSVASGLFSLPMVIRGEIFPLEFRGLGGGLSTLIGSLGYFLTLKLFTGLVRKFGMPWTFFMFGFIAVYCIGVVWLMMPETKDKTLQEIEDGFRGRKADEEVTEPLKCLEMCDRGMK